MACWPKKRSDLWVVCKRVLKYQIVTRSKVIWCHYMIQRFFFQRATLKQVEKCCLDVCILRIVPFL